MTLRWLLASLHLVALGLGMAAIWARGRALRGPLDAAGVRRVILADNCWGAAAALWLATGAWRAFGGVEKGTGYYLGQPVFFAKMGLFVLVVALEILPIVTLIRWRRAQAQGLPLAADATTAATQARTLARISSIQLVLVLGMVFAATALARGMTF